VIFVTLGDLCGEEEVRWYKSYKPPQKGESNNVTTYQGFNADLTLHLTFFFQFMLDELRRQKYGSHAPKEGEECLASLL
jgi:hypothetical protein